LIGFDEGIVFCSPQRAAGHPRLIDGSRRLLHQEPQAPTSGAAGPYIRSRRLRPPRRPAPRRVGADHAARTTPP
jgi:hypothetical protein